MGQGTGLEKKRRHEPELSITGDRQRITTRSSIRYDTENNRTSERHFSIYRDSQIPECFCYRSPMPVTAVRCYLACPGLLLTHCAQDVPYRWSANTSDFVTIAGRLSIGTSSPKLLLSLRIPQPRLADSGTRLTLTNNYCNIEKPLKDVFPLAVFNIFRLNQYRYVVAVSEVFHAASIRALSTSFPGTARSKKPLPS